jgi:hypothetical protein
MKTLGILTSWPGAAVVGPGSDASPAPTQKPAGEPDRIAVQHILISFKEAPGSSPRPPDQAEAKAWPRAFPGPRRRGLRALVKTYTDDSHPGIYRMSNFGVEPVTAARQANSRGPAWSPSSATSASSSGRRDRDGRHDPATSKYGWHIIKRLE